MRYHSFDRVRICETTGMQDGYLRIDVVNSENNFPIEGAEVSVSYGDSGQTQEVLRTNLSGQTEEIAVRSASCVAFTGRTEPGKAVCGLYGGSAGSGL